MKRFLCVLLVLLVPVAALAADFYFLPAKAKTGTDSLAEYDGTALITGQAGIVIESTGMSVYYMNATSGATADGDLVIAPATNPGSKRWHKIYPVTDPVTDTTITFTPSGASATARTLQSRLRDVYSVMDAGATGDGATDDRTALYNANADAGGVYFPPGTYRIDTDLTLTKPIIMAPGAKISVPLGVTLTLGNVQAGLYQIFEKASTATIRFAAGAQAEISPEWFGAVADGTTASYQGLQDTIACVQASTYHPKIRLAAGKYVFDTGLAITSNYVTIEGAAGAIYDPTGAVPSGAATYLHYTGSAAGITATGRGLVMRSLMLTGTSSATKGMKIGAADWHLEDMTISGFTGTNRPGLELGTTTAGTATHCAFHLNYNGVQMNDYADYVTTVRFIACSFSYNTNYGVYDRGAIMPFYEGCIFQSNTAGGLVVDQATDYQGYMTSLKACHFENVATATDIMISGASTESYQDVMIDHCIFGTTSATNIHFINVGRALVIGPRYSSLSGAIVGSGCADVSQIGGITSSITAY